MSEEDKKYTGTAWSVYEITCPCGFNWYEDIDPCDMYVDCDSCGASIWIEDSR